MEYGKGGLKLTSSGGRKVFYDLSRITPDKDLPGSDFLHS